jgi:choline dehydrogenase-like flavoprotein
MLGKISNHESYQYHQIAMGIETEKPNEYIHGQITTLKSAMVHPIISGLPLDLRSSIMLFKKLRSSLGIVNINLHDTRRENNSITLDAHPASGRAKVVITYTPDEKEAERIKRVIKRVKQCLRKLGCVIPPGMTHLRPMGASVHYAGTIPMSTQPAPYTASAYCRSHDFDNLYIVDGSTFPFLPAKNLTFTLMANAVRVAEHAF